MTSTGRHKLDRRIESSAEEGSSNRSCLQYIGRSAWLWLCKRILCSEYERGDCSAQHSPLISLHSLGVFCAANIHERVSYHNNWTKKKINKSSTQSSRCSVLNKQVHITQLVDSRLHHDLTRFQTDTKTTSTLQLTNTIEVIMALLSLTSRDALILAAVGILILYFWEKKTPRITRNGERLRYAPPVSFKRPTLSPFNLTTSITVY